MLCYRNGTDNYTVSKNVPLGVQGSVATLLRCGGIFANHFIANCPLSGQVKEFGKSVNIWHGQYTKWDSMCGSMAQWLAHLEFELVDPGSIAWSCHYSTV